MAFTFIFDRIQVKAQEVSFHRIVLLVITLQEVSDFAFKEVDTFIEVRLVYSLAQMVKIIEFLEYLMVD